LANKGDNKEKFCSGYNEVAKMTNIADEKTVLFRNIEDFIVKIELNTYILYVNIHNTTIHMDNNNDINLTMLVFSNQIQYVKNATNFNKHRSRITSSCASKHNDAP